MTSRTCAEIVVDYKDMMLVKSLTARTGCWHSHGLREHCFGVVIDYADTDKTMRKLLENFEGFSQILKEQSGKKGIWMCLHTHSNILEI